MVAGVRQNEQAIIPAVCVPILSGDVLCGRDQCFAKAIHVLSHQTHSVHRATIMLKRAVAFLKLLPQSWQRTRIVLCCSVPSISGLAQTTLIPKVHNIYKDCNVHTFSHDVHVFCHLGEPTLFFFTGLIFRLSDVASFFSCVCTMLRLWNSKSISIEHWKNIIDLAKNSCVPHVQFCFLQLLCFDSGVTLVSMSARFVFEFKVIYRPCNTVGRRSVLV